LRPSRLSFVNFAVKSFLTAKYAKKFREGREEESTAHYLFSS